MGHLDYGAVGNCRSAALISKEGSIDWFCFPDFDSPSIFSRILDQKKGGHFGFVVDGPCEISQEYVRHTNILSTTYTSEEGVFQVVDFMPRFKIGEMNSYYLPPELYRMIRLISGKPRFRIQYRPVFNYAKDKVEHRPGKTYVKTVDRKNSRNAIYLYSNLDYELILNEQPIELQQDAFLMVSYNQKLVKISQSRVDLEYNRTLVYWLDWTNRSKKFDRFNDVIERSMLILKLLSYQRSGAVLAALTTSIPEVIGRDRNWDYRFCWLRDASMSIKTLVTLGHKGAAKRFMEFIKGILKSKDESFQIMYGIRGERNLKEKTLPHLNGFAGSKPVRIGNAAFSQKQNDSLGYLMDMIYHYYLYFPGTLDEIEEMWEVVKGIVKTVVSQWREPDNGIWEIRGERKHFVISKVMCWVAMDRAVSIAQLLDEPGYVEKWSGIARQIREEVLEKGWKESIGSFSQAYGNSDLDASLLLMEDYGFISAEDPRFVKTVHAIEQGLMHNGLLFRYRNHDGLGIPSSAFTICNFWMVKALFRIGRREEALSMFERLLTYSNHLMLLSEDLDFYTGEQMGNYPQAYSHLAIIETARLFAEEKTLSRFLRP